MKKLGTVLLVLFMLFVFCSCSGKNVTEHSTNETTQITTEAKKEEVNTTKKSTKSIAITVNGKSFSAQLYDNETAQAFADMLPLTLNMNELHGNEKYYNLSSSLPSNSSNVGKINSGDIMLYGSDCLVLFYDSFSTQYSYTRIGYIENPTGLADAVGNGDVTIKFEK